ncbi:MSMEG_1061 family FMN-dependent PPOX-type flavoprotein [Reyranella sp.]|uniref:MSMEG_1061 family FMN-dependent PPOX-type flavoprotein n=1 Tax=Reyranella sp. TaxID=1929291 RepID=UPI00272798AC|nr:MSMEG_1061 family FMN-dependent PPOX-type flavoprotein [Reyranella sp.]MDO8975040.1 pyridoxamine 5'-phosphate oxidase family protein [Reyranella sp.]
MPDSLPFSAAPKEPALLDEAGARALVASYAPVSVTAAVKDIGRIDEHMGRFIARSPICLISTADASGKQDVTPRGDPPGSFKVLDEKTIALADRPGNNRLDTLRNLLENPEVALIFLLPGVNETVRLAGTARLSVDPALLASMAVQGKAPKCAIVVSVRQAYLHCAKALLRSRLWSPDYVQPKGAFPSIARMVGDQIGLSEDEKKKREAVTEHAYKEGLWAPIP